MGNSNNFQYVDSLCANSIPTKQPSWISQSLVIKQYNNTIIQVVLGEILEEPADAIVNSTYMPCDSYIMRRQQSRNEKEQVKLLKVGDVCVGKYQTQKVIHAKLPMYQEVRDLQKVYWTYLKCLEMAEKHGINSIAFTEQPTSNFQIPKQYNSEVMLRAIIKYLGDNFSKLKQISFVHKDGQTLNIFSYELEKQMDELKVPELAQRGTNSFFQFINNDAIPEQYHLSTGISSSVNAMHIEDKSTLSKEQLYQ